MDMLKSIDVEDYFRIPFRLGKANIQHHQVSALRFYVCCNLSLFTSELKAGKKNH